VQGYRTPRERTSQSLSCRKALLAGAADWTELSASTSKPLSLIMHDLKEGANLIGVPPFLLITRLPPSLLHHTALESVGPAALTAYARATSSSQLRPHFIESEAAVQLFPLSPPYHHTLPPSVKGLNSASGLDAVLQCGTLRACLTPECSVSEVHEHCLDSSRLLATTRLVHPPQPFTMRRQCLAALWHRTRC
jgi:hypothetical protein